ncbi:lipopolysaccharide assembly protein LapA domain-containing protein [Minwuia thermotolerans]|uniref:lipopolysaccharide assembly protein LapA domain-containing protein n=1 Tax=Minwuia thermotolerans TaxID=2056226 RepID=UPI0013DE38AD|nr:LapA family protein [Minwuia thermotolerans]
MKFLKILLFLAILVIGVSIGLSNRQAVELRLEPVPYAIDLPLFVVIFAAMFAGLLIGALAMWLRDGRVRRRARQAEHRAQDLEREVRQSGDGERADRPALQKPKAA